MKKIVLLVVLYLIIGYLVTIALYFQTGNVPGMCLAMIGAKCPQGFGIFVELMRSQIANINFWMQVLGWPIYVVIYFLNPSEYTRLVLSGYYGK